MSTHHVELAIIGAGVAGLAAAARAAELGIAFVLLEATDRIGGRVHTVRRADGTLWDRGASRLRQPAINPLVGEAEQRSLLTRRPWQLTGGVAIDGEWLPELDVDDVWHQIDEIEELARALAAGGDDVPVLDLLDPDFSEPGIVEAVLTHAYGSEPDSISAIDVSRFGPFEGAWPVEFGLGRLVEETYGSIPVELESPVAVVDWGADPVRVDLGSGLVEADRVLVTVSTGVLAGEVIQFAPDLPADVTAAIEGLSMGSTNRVVFALDAIGDLPTDSILYSISGSESVCFETPPDGSHIVIATVAGQLSRELELAGGDAMIDLVAEHAGRILGTAARQGFGQAETTTWGLDLYVLGANSCAQPGAVHARSILATGVGDRLFFAGEAVSKRSFGTVHGALRSGIDAVNRIAFVSGHLTEKLSDSDNPDVFAFDF